MSLTPPARDQTFIELKGKVVLLAIGNPLRGDDGFGPVNPTKGDNPPMAQGEARRRPLRIFSRG